MQLIFRSWGLTLFLVFLHFQIFGQDADIGKRLFPEDKNAQWLVDAIGQPISKKIFRKFKKKLGNIHDSDINDSYSGTIYPKNVPKVRTGHYDKKTSYSLRTSTDSNDPYIEMSISRGGLAPLFNFMNAPTIEALGQKVEDIKTLELHQMKSDKHRKKLHFFYHDYQFYISATYEKENGRIWEVEVSAPKYLSVQNDILIQKLREKTKGLYTEKHIDIDPATIVKFKYSGNYQIGNMLYCGVLKDGLPHGKARWGINADDRVYEYFNTIRGKDQFLFFAEGEFENGKAVGDHEIKINDEKMVYTYEAGRLTKIQKYNNPFYITLNEDGSYKKVAAMPVKFGNHKKLLYYGEIDEDRQAHDTYGTIYFDSDTKVSTAFVHGKPKSGEAAYFIYVPHDVKVATQVNEQLQMTGKTEITSQSKGDKYSGTVYLKNGKIDPSQTGELTFENFAVSDDLKGRTEVKGKIEVINFGSGTFAGEDLTLVFSSYSNTKFQGNFNVKNGRVVPSGWHTATNYQNGVVQNSFKGKYSPSGSFLEGDNMYKKERSLVYDRGTFTDSRNGMTYPYKTLVKENGQLITWMMEDVYYEDYTNEVWSYGSSYNSRKKCYYSQRNSKIACPNGWRLPSAQDLREIYNTNTQDKKYITNHVTLINLLNLDRNGYVWLRYGKTDLRRAEYNICFWLDSGKYLSITDLNQGSNTGLDADDRYHTCRCVKDGKL